jgi:hypothetical protein
LLLRFRTKHNQEVEMGYYLGDGKVRILGHHIGRQLALTLDEIESWQAVNPAQLQEIENVEERQSGTLAETPADQRHEHRGDAEASRGRHSESPDDRGAAFCGFKDLEDAAEWAGLDQETPSGIDTGIEPGYLFPGE